MRTYSVKNRVFQRLFCLLLLVTGATVTFAQSDALSLVIGQNTIGVLSTEAPSVQYVVTAAGGENATLQVFAVSTDLRPTFRVIDPAGVEIAASANADDEKMLTANVSFLDAGDYLIEIASANGTSGQFFISLLPTTTPTPIDLVVDQAVSDSVGSETPLRAYRFATTSGDALTLTILPDGDAGVGISLFDEDANKTVAVQDASLRGASIHLPSQEHQYRLEIRAGDADTSPYSVCLGVCEGVSTTAPSAGTTASAATSATACTVTSSTGGSVNVRSGPGTQYLIVGSLAAGQSYPVLGQTADGSWHQISFTGGEGWVASSVTQLDGDCADLPVAAAPVNARLAPTQAPAPTQPPATNPPPSSGEVVPTTAPPSAPTNEPPPAAPLPDVSVQIVIAANEGSNSVALHYTVYYTDPANGGLSQPFNETICLDSNCINAGPNVMSPNISLSESAVFNLDDVDPTRRVHTFRVTVDTSNAIAESNEGNNVATYNVSF